MSFVYRPPYDLVQPPPPPHTPSTFPTAGATWRANLNTDITGLNVDSDVPLRLRYEIKITVAPATTPAFKWQYRKNGGTWTDITAASSNVKTLNSANFADGDDVISQLLGTEAYNSSNAAAEETSGTFTMPNDFLVGTVIETEIAVTIISADLANLDDLDFRIVKSNATVLDTYTQTATLTDVSKGAGGSIIPIIQQHRRMRQ